MRLFISYVPAAAIGRFCAQTLAGRKRLRRRYTVYASYYKTLKNVKISEISEKIFFKFALFLILNYFVSNKMMSGRDHSWCY